MCNHDRSQATDRRSFLKAATAGTAAIAAANLISTAAQAQAAGPEQPEKIIKDWPETATKAAKAMMEKIRRPGRSDPEPADLVR